MRGKNGRRRKKDWRRRRAQSFENERHEWEKMSVRGMGLFFVFDAKPIYNDDSEKNRRYISPKPLLTTIQKRTVVINDPNDGS